MRFAPYLIVSLALSLPAETPKAATPWLNRVSPLGGQAGTIVTIELTGSHLQGSTGALFDSADLSWIETIEAKEGKVQGKLKIASDAALGPHLLHLISEKGPSNTLLFNVTQFPGVMEIEPNNTAVTAQTIPLRSQVVYGYMQGLADSDMFSFQARAGERWLFDLQSIERGGFLECSLTLYDEQGREVAFNEDQDEYLETPRLEFIFPKSGRYAIKVDQYRGPQGVSCDQNCSYLLQISQLPLVISANPLGGRVGSTVRIDLQGHALNTVQQVYLTPVRSAEYYRLTFPFSIPLRFDKATVGSQQIRIPGHILQTTPDNVSADFKIPPDAPTGLWRIWVVSTAGKSEGINIEISNHAEYTEKTSVEANWLKGEVVINGALKKTSGENSYNIELKAGVPFHAWTLAAQLGLPCIDTVLELFDTNGKRLAEHDDLMTGQGTVIGNPDSSLYFTPKSSGPAKLVVRDRTGRGGSGYSYRLHLASQTPSFSILTAPEEFTISPGNEADLEALLIREPGFEQAVDIWIEGLPNGATATRGGFRADQAFGPSGDGDNINIPSTFLKIQMPANVPVGKYPIRVLGRATNGGATIEGFTTLWIGPKGKRNDTRRPLPQILIHVAQ